MGWQVEQWHCRSGWHNSLVVTSRYSWTDHPGSSWEFMWSSWHNVDLTIYMQKISSQFKGEGVGVFLSSFPIPSSFEVICVSNCLFDEGLALLFMWLQVLSLNTTKSRNLAKAPKRGCSAHLNMEIWNWGFPPSKHQALSAQFTRYVTSKKYTWGKELWF